MAKNKIIFICNECGHEEPKWLGRCPDCGNWNSFREIQKQGKSSGAGQGRRITPGDGQRPRTMDPVLLGNIRYSEHNRIDSGLNEVNGVLGGGIMLGASVLIGGEPGIGKSTLMLQLAAAVTIDKPVLYVSGEESAQQIRMRAERLGIVPAKRFETDVPVESDNSPGIRSKASVVQDQRDITGSQGIKSGRGKSLNLHLICESDLDRILSILNKLNPVIVVIDSIQTLISQDAGNIPGTVNQLKFGCHELIDWARERNAAMFLVAHVTKEGSIAGPKVIEHMVDTVLYFEQADTGVRIIRAVKNRHGSIDEIGLFTMEENGLEEVNNPVSFFLQQRKTLLPPGITAAPVYEGSRVLMVEIQALVVPAKSGFSRIYSDKVDNNRVSRISAVLEKHLSIRFSDQDIYVNVAGGMRLNEVGIELPLAIALYSARTGISVPRECALAGEISLAGEIRPTAHMQRRIRTAAEMGFNRFIGPRDVHRRFDKQLHDAQGDGQEKKILEATGSGFTSVDNIARAVKLVFNGRVGNNG